MAQDSNLLKLNLSIGILSSAIIAFQIILIQILSITQWYHFAFMAISIALLGFGAAGTFLSLFKNKLLSNNQAILPILLFLTSLLMVLVIKVSNINEIRFDSFLLLNNLSSHIWHLFFTYLLFFLPFFFGALAIGLSFLVYKNQIGKIYFANLTGSGIGGIIVILFMWVFSIKELPVIISFFPLASGIILLRKQKLVTPKIFATLSTLIIIIMLFYPTQIVPSEYKSLSKTMLLPDAKIISEKNSPFGLCHIVSSPVLRSVPGLSLNYNQEIPISKAIFVNGNWAGTIRGLKDTTAAKIMDHTTKSLPFIINKPINILSLNTGICEYASYVIYKNIKNITITEPNSSIIKSINSELMKNSDSLLLHPGISLKNIEARTFLSLTSSKYDLILLPTIGTFGGNLGINAFQEQYLLTTEAFDEMWQKLSPKGMISVSCWIDYPVKKPIKILATIIEMLEKNGIENTRTHISAIRNWNLITFSINKSPVSKTQIDSVKSFCNIMSFDPLILESSILNYQEQFNDLNNNNFFEIINDLFTSKRKILYETYDFNVIPASDNCPYFFQFIRWKNKEYFSSISDSQSNSFMEIGYIIVIITFLQIVILSSIFIILPLLRKTFKIRNKFKILTYFGSIGIGYMFFEIVLIQQFILYLGNPVYATTAVISLILISSGFGSYFSQKLKISKKNIFILSLIITSILITYAFILTPILQVTILLSSLNKLGIMIILIAIPGFLMGIPFPLGISYISQKSTNEIPWAWGINGYFSVISTALATIIAVEAGFLWVLILAGIMYFFTALSSLKTLQ